MMNNDLLLLIEKHTETLIDIEQTKKTKTQETLEYKLNKQLDSFSCCPSFNISEEWKFLIAVTGFEATNSDFKT